MPTLLLGLMTVSVLVDVEASTLFGDENVNWRFCVNYATFRHQDDDVCEFILHIGTDWEVLGSAYEYMHHRMVQFGCTPEFVELYAQAAQTGAARLLLYV